MTELRTSGSRVDRFHALLRLMRATRNSLKGLQYAASHEAAIREEIVLVFIGIIAAMALDVSKVEAILLIGSLLLVFIVELLNSAIEATVDRIGPDFHPLSGAAKDMASAAVLLTLLCAIVIWCVILV